MSTSLDEVSLWLTGLVLFLVFSAVAIVTRTIARKKLSESAQEDLETQAGKMITGFAAAFAFFTGVALTMTWGALSAGQAAVEDLAAKSQQVGWAIGNLENQTAADQLQDRLTAYLQAVVTADLPYLAAGRTADLPSEEPMDKMQDAIHAYAYAPNTPSSESGALVSSIQALGTSNSSFAAIAERAMPGLMGFLLLVTATLLTVTVSLSSISINRPFLVILWCLVVALSISFVLALDHPFGGSVTANMQPLIDVANGS